MGLSHRAAHFETFIVIAIQGLGKVDAQLTARDAAFLKLPQGRRESIEVSGDLTERFTSSYLWVLGAYEIIRTLDQRCREDPSLVSEETARIIRDAKHKFERVRMPLAKFKPARRFKETDTAVAFPALHREHGIAWCVADNVVVARKELSDCFMTVMQSLDPPPH